MKINIFSSWDFSVNVCEINMMFQIAKFEETLKEKNDLLTCFKGSKVRKIKTWAIFRNCNTVLSGKAWTNRKISTPIVLVYWNKFKIYTTPKRC